MNDGDVWLPRMVVCFIGLIGLVGLSGSIIMPSPPAYLSNIVTGAMMGLLGLIAPSPFQPKVKP